MDVVTLALLMKVFGPISDQTNYHNFISFELFGVPEVLNFEIEVSSACLFFLNYFHLKLIVTDFKGLELEAQNEISLTQFGASNLLFPEI